MAHLTYDGHKVSWPKVGNFKATSGMLGSQKPSFQCEPNKGPVPEGTYYIPLILGTKAEDDGKGICQLKPSWRIETIPRGIIAGKCEPYWANWGYNRVRFEPNDKATKSSCNPRRSGFYLHDSTKGFSHGCIEINTKFFVKLREYAKKNKGGKLILKIDYKHGSTFGGTKI